MHDYPPEAVTAITKFLARLRLKGRRDTSSAVAGSLGNFFTETGDIAPEVLPDLAGDVTGAIGTNTVGAIQGQPVSATDPTLGQTLVWDGSAYVPTTPSGTGGGHTIEDEGTPLTQRTNLNFTGQGVTVTDSGGKTVVAIPGTDVYATDAELAAAIAAHEAASDPHPGYLTPAELAAAIAALFTGKGDLLAGTGSGTWAVLPAPALTGYYLRTDPTEPTGLRWVPLPDELLTLVFDGTDQVVVGTDRVVAE